MAHTPGPWRLKHTTDVIAGGQEDPVTVAKCWSSSFAPPRSEAKANARLIAASPELLAACKNLVAILDAQGWSFRPAMRDARAAIAKAEATSSREEKHEPINDRNH